MTQSILSLAQKDATAERRGPVVRLAVLPLTLLLLPLAAIVPMSFTGTNVMVSLPKMSITLTASV